MTLVKIGARWVGRYKGRKVCGAIAPAGRVEKDRLADKCGGGFRYLFTLEDLHLPDRKQRQ